MIRSLFHSFFALSASPRFKAFLLAFAVILLLQPAMGAPHPASKSELWSLRPVVRGEVPQNGHANPIDAFLAEELAAKSVAPLPAADKLTWLRRVTFDLTGLPPSLEEQDAFLGDASPDAFEKVADRLLASEQHGVRYARHWLDVLRYADVDEGMPASNGIYLWRDWIINALNHDLPYDAFVRAQICGNRARERTRMVAVGIRVPVEPRAEDMFALGLLARGAMSDADKEQQLAISAVETISTAFMGMTVGCAKCHDHFYDPIKQTDFYSMKALFDPLVLEKVNLGTAGERFQHGIALDEFERKKRAIEEPLEKLIAPYRTRLYDERVKMLPPDVQAVIRKPERARSAAEQKIADDYYPILRIDPPKIKAVMPAAEKKEYDAFEKKLEALKGPEPLPVFWTVREDSKRLEAKSYVLTTGDPARPKLNQEVPPGFPFADHIEFREGRREAFVDWLTDGANPLFARVAVNRIWQWHFGSGLHGNANDFGTLGGKPIHPKLLDYLASEFIAHDYSMKWLHRLIVTSETYRRASTAPRETLAAAQNVDPDDHLLWRFPVQRLEAEPIRDAILSLAGNLDLRVGGKSFDGSKASSNRRSIYMKRGFRSSADLMPDFLTAFDAEDGRAVCPRRNQTVTAPQALFMMNNDFIDGEAARFGERLKTLAQEHPDSDAVTLGYRCALGRRPTASEHAKAEAFLAHDPADLKPFAWLLMNLDEFIYVR